MGSQRPRALRLSTSDVCTRLGMALLCDCASDLYLYSSGTAEPSAELTLDSRFPVDLSCCQTKLQARRIRSLGRIIIVKAVPSVLRRRHAMHPIVSIFDAPGLKSARLFSPTHDE
ncbi:hypothetical protein MPTK1_6g04840 [Marchantia polymorpha subsp. ruderalis]|uniref:Uncharacterized protein n=2 Tax=Marchantia polymorpha TaxID=3197 RepID=A0AAF6BNL0_MARPO|nr:hypothetical protein MARPO_0034s0033 [Marchantia polymorpha]BBN13594.1 hypothetical protein Mp_6g04840 [Marchantia polymorpha subsp. ruderalis]|eukprot:PTQ41436.1 hypothetical protein MARPO_0034s0033 [Marchantia polymorpha]